MSCYLTNDEVAWELTEEIGKCYLNEYFALPEGWRVTKFFPGDIWDWKQMSGGMWKRRDFKAKENDEQG